MKKGTNIQILASEFFWQPRHPKTTTFIHIATPTPLEEKNLGQLFMIMEIDDDNQAQNTNILELIKEEIENNYYNTDEQNPGKALEKALKQTNQKVGEIVKEAGTDWLSKYSVTIGVSYGKKLYFAEQGSIHIHLIHQSKIIDLLEKNTVSEITNPLKTFSNIFSGHLDEEDSIVLCTSSLLDYLSLEKLKRVINENKKPENASENLKKLLVTENNGETSFAAIILKAHQNKAKEEEKTINHIQKVTLNRNDNQTPENRDSMERLVSQEQKTNELLSPSIMPNLKEAFRTMLPKKDEENTAQQKQKNTKEKEQKIEKTMEKSIKNTKVKKLPIKPILKVLKTAWGILKNLILQIISGILKVISKITQGRKEKQLTGSVNSLPYRANKGISKGILNLKDMPVSRKIVLLSAIVLIVIFSWSITNLGSKQEEKVQNEEHKITIEQIEDNIVKAESNMIFNNEAEARKLVIDSGELLKTIPDTEEFAAQKQDLNKTLESKSRELNKITEIENPENIGTLETEANELSFLEENFYSLDAKNGKIYQTSQETSETKTIETQSYESPSIGLHSILNNDYLTVHDDKSLRTRNITTGTTSETAIEASPDNTTFTHTNLYNQRLYVLDAESNQIYKYNAIKNGYTISGPWINDASADLSTAKSFAIDGSIYILTDSGVTKYFNGKQDNDWLINSIEPSLETATLIKTEAEFDNLYILDPNNKRIIIFDKQSGNLVKQYTSEKFSSLRDMHINDDESTVTLLNGNTLYKVSVN